MKEKCVLKEEKKKNSAANIRVWNSIFGYFVLVVLSSHSHKYCTLMSSLARLYFVNIVYREIVLLCV